MWSIKSFLISNINSIEQKLSCIELIFQIKKKIDVYLFDLSLYTIRTQLTMNNT